VGHLETVKQRRGRWAVTAIGLLMLLLPAAAYGNSQAGYVLNNANNCGGTCHLRGTKSDITSPSSFNVVGNQSGVETVGASDCPDTSCLPFAESGIVDDRNVTFTYDCDNKNTYPTIHNFDEIEDNGGSKSCIVRDSSDSETNQFKTQRETLALCSGISSNCVANTINGIIKQMVHFNHDQMGNIYVEGELVRDTGSWWDSNTSVSADYPGSGTIFWERTSDIDSGGTSSWTTIQSAACVPGTHWFVGSISGGFNIHFVTSGGSCP
jgi:hypothetical protein